MMMLENVESVKSDFFIKKDFSESTNKSVNDFYMFGKNKIISFWSTGAIRRKNTDKDPGAIKIKTNSVIFLRIPYPPEWLVDGFDMP